MPDFWKNDFCVDIDITNTSQPWTTFRTIRPKSHESWWAFFKIWTLPSAFFMNMRHVELKFATKRNAPQPPVSMQSRGRWWGSSSDEWWFWAVTIAIFRHFHRKWITYMRLEHAIETTHWDRIRDCEPQSRQEERKDRSKLIDCFMDIRSDVKSYLPRIRLLFAQTLRNLRAQSLGIFGLWVKLRSLEIQFEWHANFMKCWARMAALTQCQRTLIFPKHSQRLVVQYFQEPNRAAILCGHDDKYLHDERIQCK